MSSEGSEDTNVSHSLPQR